MRDQLDPEHLELPLRLDFVKNPRLKCSFVNLLNFFDEAMFLFYFY